MPDFENHEVVKEFREAEALIKGSFQSLNVSLVLYMMYALGVKHFPHSLTRNGPGRNRTYLQHARGMRNV